MTQPTRPTVGLLVAVWCAAAGCRRDPLPFMAAPSPGTDAPATVFVAAAPCETEADYVIGATTVDFGFLGSPASLSYQPKCLRVGVGDTVTFAGDFATHPLYPSRERGTRPGNPIPAAGTGRLLDVTFDAPGTFAYYCGIHGAFDDGQTMAGVVWVR